MKERIFQTAPLSIFMAFILAACSVCERKTDADGSYDVLTDCSEDKLVQGPVIIGSDSELALTDVRMGCDSDNSADAGMNLSYKQADGGSRDSLCGAPMSTATSCPETWASGALQLGLPWKVRVNGKREFDLYGDVAGRSVECTPEQFGDEKVLFCRASGRIVCSAIVQAN